MRNKLKSFIRFIDLLIGQPGICNIDETDNYFEDIIFTIKNRKAVHYQPHGILS